MNKRIINITLLLMVFISLISFSANAAFADIFRAGLTPIEDFFSGGWQNYEKTVSFIVFFFLFFTAFLIGMKNAKVFGDKLTRVHIAFAFVAAFLSSLIITVNIGLEWINIKYIAWGLLVILTFFVIYALLSKLLGKHKFWAFILALILTALLLWLIWYLMHEGRPLEGWGRVSDWFGRLGKGKPSEGKPVKWEEGPPLEEKKKVTTKGWFGSNWWIVLIVLIPALVGGEVWRRRRRRRPGEGPRRGGGGEGGPEVGAPKDPIEKIIEYLDVIKRRKKKINANIKYLEENKADIMDKLKTLLAKINKEGLEKFIQNIAPFLRDPKSSKFKKLSKEEKDIQKLIFVNMRMFVLLRELINLESYLIRNETVIKDYIQKMGINSKEIDGLFYNLKNISSEVIGLLQKFFEIERREDLIERDIKELLSDKYIEERVKKKWIIDKANTEKHLKQVTDAEFKVYSEIKKSIKKEIDAIEQIIKKLKVEKEKKEKMAEEEEKKERKGEEKKGEEKTKKVVKGGIKPIKVPRFASTESDMIGRAVSTKPNKWGISKEILEETHKEVRKRFDEIQNKRSSIQGIEEIKIEDGRSPSGQNRYVPRRIMDNNPYSGRNIEWTGRYISKVYGPLFGHWDENVERIKRSITFVKEKGKEGEEGKKGSIFKEKEYKRKDVFILPQDASHLYSDIKDENRDSRTIEQMQNLDKAWQSWWNMFVLGVWQFNRLIKKINEQIEKEGVEQQKEKRGIIVRTEQVRGTMIPIERVT